MAGRSQSAPETLAAPAPMAGPRRALEHAQHAWPVEGRLFVGNLPYGVSPSALLNEVRLRFGRPFAIVQFERAVDAMDAETSIIFVGGRRARVEFVTRPAVPPRPGIGPTGRLLPHTFQRLNMSAALLKIVRYDQRTTETAMPRTINRLERSPAVETKPLLLVVLNAAEASTIIFKILEA